MDTSYFTGAKDLLLLILGLYGAILSTINWRTAVRKDRRQIKIATSTIMPTYGPALGPPLIKIEAINVGHRTVTIDTLTLELPSGARMFPTSGTGVPGIESTRLPITLSDGQSAQFVLAYGEIGHSLKANGFGPKVKLRPVCVDTAGNVYKGKAWKSDPDELIRMSSS